jgi:hypothetical protein
MVAKRKQGLALDLMMLSPALVLLASCVGPASGPAAAQRPLAAAPAPSVAPTRPAQPAFALSVSTPVEWQYRPLTPGAWRYQGDAAGSLASFGADTAVLRCDRATGRISLRAAGSGGAMTVRTSYGAAIWPAVTQGGQLIATRAASDSGLDQIAYSRGKIALESAGQPALILPAWAELSRVIEDCRG